MTRPSLQEKTDDPRRELVLGLVGVLKQCSEPHAVAARMMSGLLISAGELGREIGRILDDMEALARLEEQTLPEEDLAAARRDCQEMGQLRQDLELDRLFSSRTRQRCGRYAVPLLALALARVWLRVDFASGWLDRRAGLAVRVDDRLHYLRRLKVAAESNP